MQIEDRSLEHGPNALIWRDPIAMFVAWLARLFAQITNLKRIRRTTRFKPNWRDHWSGLRQCEWLRDQTLAAGAAQLLAGKDLDLSNFIPQQDPPANYGGPCPSSPFEMNRRFLALARFNADPESAIRAHAARISSCPLRLAARSTSPGFAEGGKVPRSLSSSGASRRGRWHALAHDGGGSHSSRGPPTSSQIQYLPPQRPARLRSHPHARTLTSTPVSTTYPPSLGEHAHEAREARLNPRVVSTPASVSPCHLTSR